MKIERFKTSSPSIQSSYLWVDGECICTIKNNDSALLLYSLYDNLIEVKMGKEIETITVLDSKADLSRYAEQVELPEITFPE